MKDLKSIITSSVTFLIAFGLLLSGTHCANAPAAEWTSLLDESLSQWDMYLSYKHKLGYTGEIPTDENGEIVQPVGYNNNVNNVFTVLSEGGEPVLKVTGEYYGSVFTKQEYENYHFTVKVRWGEKKWEPRMELLRDSGVLYHSIGENGIDYWRSWKLSQEFQVMEGHMGDYWSVGTAGVDIRAFKPERRMCPVASVKQPFLAFGGDTEAGGFCLRSGDYESPQGEWTTLELVSFGDKSVHIVNGEVVMVLRNSHYRDGDQVLPLTRGKIQLQSEAAEVYYKDVRIRPLDEMPAAYTAYFE